MLPSLWPKRSATSGTGMPALSNSVATVWRTVVALLKQNGFEKNGFVKIRATSAEFNNGSVIRAVASDYKGEAGGRQTLAIFDELWGFDSERAERLFEEA